jgi:hypothetical protein
MLCIKETPTIVIATDSMPGLSKSNFIRLRSLINGISRIGVKCAQSVQLTLCMEAFDTLYGYVSDSNSEISNTLFRVSLPRCSAFKLIHDKDDFNKYVCGDNFVATEICDDWQFILYHDGDALKCIGHLVALDDSNSFGNYSCDIEMLCNFSAYSVKSIALQTACPTTTYIGNASWRFSIGITSDNSFKILACYSSDCSMELISASKEYNTLLQNIG